MEWINTHIQGCNMLHRTATACLAGSTQQCLQLLSPQHALLSLCRTEAREELRRQVGTLRFDLNSLAAPLAKDERKAALALRKDFQ